MENEHPGVYVEESGFRSQPIAGVTTTTKPWWFKGVVAASGVAAVVLLRRAWRRKP